MATKVHMEALSPTMEEGQVVKWLKSEGESVVNGDVLAEIETDKATMELTARGEGVLRKILVDEGGTAPVGEVIAVIGAEDEDISELVEEAGEDGKEPAAEEEEAEAAEEAEEEEAEEAEAAEAEEEEKEAAEEEPEEEEEAAEEEAAEEEPEEEEEAAEKEEAAPEGDGRVKASPLARRLAEEAGIDLSRVEGSGPGGRIVKSDVESAREEAEAAPARAPEMAEEEYEDVSLSQMRKTIARRLTESLGPVPHFFLTVEVDMGRALAARKRINEMLEEDGKVSVNDLILKATAAALKRHPECNAHWNGDSIRRFHRVHLGVAVAVEDGLITPVIRDAHRKGVAEIGAEIRELAERAREKKLKPDEYTGATFSVSNLGMMGIREFTAVINPPEAGILAVGRVEEIPVADHGAERRDPLAARGGAPQGEVVVRPRMRMTMSCDHRVIDGATGARFLQTLRGMLEEPGAMVV